MSEFGAEDKLKTLKDIIDNKFTDWNAPSSFEDNLTPDKLFDKLKQEAIKDYFALENNKIDFGLINIKKQIEIKAVQRYIKWKFNITEEELK